MAINFNKFANYLLVLLTLSIISACSSTQEQSQPQQKVPSSDLQVQTNVIQNSNDEPAVNRSKGVVKNKSGSAYSRATNNNQALPQLLALMPVFSAAEKDQEHLEMMRESIFNHLSSTNFLFMRSSEVDQRIQLLNQQQGFTQQDAEFLTGLLDVDGILLARIVSSDITYVGVASHIYFKIEIQLVDAKNQVIWEDTFSERSLEGGVGADPFTMLYSLAVTAMHAGKENVFAVTDRIGRMIATSIPQPEGAFTSHGLFIESVVHDASNKTLKYGDVIKVGVKAPSNHNVNVSIEGINQLFSARETNQGSYFVDIPVDKNWNGRDLMLTAYLVDSMGNRARKISSLGLIQLDNTPPSTPTEAFIELTEGEITLQWDSNEPGLTYAIYELDSNDKKLVNKTRKDRLEISRDLVPFSEYSYELVAEDDAKNQSQPVLLRSLYLPNKALKQAKIINTGKLPKVISKDSRLTKSNSPYFVDDITRVATNAMLFIEPGTIIEFSRSGSLNVLGGLNTYGLTPIILRAVNNNQSDHTFIKLDSQRHVELNGFRITNAGIGIEVLSGKPVIRNGEILNSKFSALSILNQSNVSARNLVINGSNTSAVLVANDARLSIKQSQFKNNMPFHIQNSSVYTVDATQNTWQPAADMITVLGKVKY